jgi:hypothetical protein
MLRYSDATRLAKAVCVRGTPVRSSRSSGDPRMEIALERRNHARLSLQLKVNFGIENPHYSGVIDSMSFGGVRILSAHTFLKGTVIKLRFSPPNDATVFESQAAVVWVQDKKSMGVHFLGLQPGQILILERILTGSATGKSFSDMWD